MNEISLNFFITIVQQQGRNIMQARPNEDLEIFYAFNEIINRQYQRTDLNHLLEYRIGEENSLQFIFRIDKKNALKKYSSYKVFGELDFITKEIKYHTGVVTFLRPYINNPLLEHGTYLQTREDLRYLMYANATFQCFYNYWDRIGDLLSIFFETGLNESNNYFGRVLTNFPEEFKESPNYKWLKSIYDEHLRTLLNERNDIVHIANVGVKTYMGFIFNIDNKPELTRIQNEKEHYPELFHQHLTLALTGFEKAVLLIDELPNKDQQ
jgi:hypothetical protein